MDQKQEAYANGFERFRVKLEAERLRQEAELQVRREIALAEARKRLLGSAG